MTATLAPATRPFCAGHLAQFREQLANCSTAEIFWAWLLLGEAAGRPEVLGVLQEVLHSRLSSAERAAFDDGRGDLWEGLDRGLAGGVTDALLSLGCMPDSPLACSC